MDILRVLSTPDLEVRKKTLQLALDLVSSRNVEEVSRFDTWCLIKTKGAVELNLFFSVVLPVSWWSFWKRRWSRQTMSQNTKTPTSTGSCWCALSTRAACASLTWQPTSSPWWAVRHVNKEHQNTGWNQWLDEFYWATALFAADGVPQRHQRGRRRWCAGVCAGSHPEIWPPEASRHWEDAGSLPFHQNCEVRRPLFVFVTRIVENRQTKVRNCLIVLYSSIIWTPLSFYFFFHWLTGYNNVMISTSTAPSQNLQRSVMDPGRILQHKGRHPECNDWSAQVFGRGMSEE